MADRPTTITVTTSTGGTTYYVRAPRCQKLAHEGMDHAHRWMAIDEAKDILERNPGAILRVCDANGQYDANATSEALLDAKAERGVA